MQPFPNVNAIAKYSNGSKTDSILYAAINSGSFEIVKLLVENGANLEYRDYEKTACETASNLLSIHIKEYR